MDDGRLTLASVGEVAAVVPYVLGITPQDSLVVVPTRPRTVPVARIDMPRTPREQALAAESIARAYAGRGGQVVLLAYTDRLDLAVGACKQLRARLEPETAVVAIAAVQGDQWVRLDSADSGAIGQGTRDRFAAEYAFRGHSAPYLSEEELKASFQPARPGRELDCHDAANHGPREARATKPWTESRDALTRSMKGQTLSTHHTTRHHRHVGPREAAARAPRPARP